MSFVTVAIVGAAATVASGAMASDAAGNAADKQLQGTREGQAQQLAMYQQQRQDLQPYVYAGQGSLNQLTQGTMPGGDLVRRFGASDFQTDPGYQFRMEQGQRAIEGTGASRGMQLSGNTLAALTSFGQNLGSQEYQNAYSRYVADQANRAKQYQYLASMSQNSAAGQASAAGTTGELQAQYSGAAGTAAARGDINQANIYQGTAGQLSNLAGQYGAYQRQPQQQPVQQADPFAIPPGGYGQSVIPQQTSGVQTYPYQDVGQPVMTSFGPMNQ